MQCTQCRCGLGPPVATAAPLADCGVGCAVRCRLGKTAAPDPTLTENLSKPFGRGVMLMKAYMTEVAFNSQGNRVKMRYLAS